MKRSRAASTKPRRPKGEGSIVERSDGRWAYVLTVGKDKTTGARQRRTIYARTRPELIRRMQDERARSGGTLRPREPGTVGAFLDVFLADEVEPKRARSTYALYEMLVRKHVAPIIGDARLDSFDAEAVAGFYKRLRETKAGSRTQVACARLLHRAFEVRRRSRGIPNPVALVEPPAHRYAAVRTMTKAEAGRFLAAARDDRYEAAYVLMLTAGLRIGEALALEWGDVNWEKRTLRVERAQTDVAGAIEVGPTKTTRSRRMVPLTPTAIAALRRRQRAQRNEKHKSPLIFTTPEGKDVRRSNLRRDSFDDVLKAAKVGHVSFHSLRHCAATFMAEAGVDIKTLLTVLGQTRPSTALDHYLHSSPGAQRDAARRMEGFLRPKKAVRR